MKKISLGIFTTSRSEYGILSPLINRLKNNNKFYLKLFVGGSHSLKSFGKTFSEIKKSKSLIKGKFNFFNDKDSPIAISENLSKITLDFGKIFKKNKLDFICVLGDRYELIPIILNATISKVPIIHIGGGESTLGSIDQQIRNMISKASHIHFVVSENYRKKLIEIGESPKRVFTVGSLAIENIKKMKKISKQEIFKKLSLNYNKKTILFTYHPSTLELKESIKFQVENILRAINQFDYQVVITSPNFEVGSSEIRKIIFKYLKKKSNFFYFKSLGFYKYHSLLSHCDFIIGNSSSGLFEAPFYKIPTINIGSRQDGRIRHKSVVDVNFYEREIVHAIRKISSKYFCKKIKKFSYKFGQGNSSKKIENILLKANSKKILVKKN